MNKCNSFEELKNARLEAYNAMRKGGVLGFLDQHTGFYSDHVHFIYELLQNAEDMEATEVSFKLFQDKLIFEHNGTKRDFTLDDIDAITSKGKSPKADDPTQIGKFGMGFKAVYVYTNTPEIHSGEFNFRIENVIVPNNEGVPKTAKANLTQFIFPFDNPNMPAQTAVKEIIKDGFEELNETSLLFLTHIKTIRYCQPDGGTGYISIENKISNIYFICAITVKKPNSEKIVTYWAKFSDNCPIMVNSNDSHNKAIKKFPVSIAYRLNKNENNVFSLDSSLVGKVCLFFPTEMESLLHFHINAPFASTVARNVIQSKGEDGEANTKLIRKLADLTAESLHWFKKAKMLDYAAYSTLPSLRDYNNQPDSRYKIFASRIKEEFENNELFIADNGNYYAIKDVFKAANKDVKTILPTKFVEKIYNKSWIPTVPSVTRVEYFIDQFKIKEYSIENFIDSLEENSNCFDELFSEQNNVEYFKTLYYQLSQSNEISKFSWLGPISRNEILSDVKFILCEDKKIHSPKENIFLRTDYQPKHYLKNPIYVELPLKNTIQDGVIKKFLLSLGIKEMCEREDLIADISGDNVPIDDMICKIMEIVDNYKSDAIDIECFKNSPIFIATDDNNGKIFKVKATECCWNESSAFFFKRTQYTLAQEYYRRAGNDLSAQLLKEVFTKLGGKVDPLFEKGFLGDEHPQFGSIKKCGVERETSIRKDYKIAEFYNFSELNLIKEKDLKEASLILWKQVLKENDKNKLLAVYRANRSVEPQYMESSLVYYLKRTAWVPTKSGTYKHPYELTDEDLLDDFKYEEPSLLLSAISEKPNDIAEQTQLNAVKSLGFKNIEDFEEIKRKAELYDRAESEGRIAPESNIEEPVAKTNNIEKRTAAVIEDTNNASDRTYEQKTRSVRMSGVKNQAAAMLKTLYTNNEDIMICQCCGKELPFKKKNGEYYFETVGLDNRGGEFFTSETKYPYIACCPNCAAMFNEHIVNCGYSKNEIADLIEKIKTGNTIKKPNGNEIIEIIMDGKIFKLTFVQKHIVSIRAVLKSNEK